METKREMNKLKKAYQPNIDAEKAALAERKNLRRQTENIPIDDKDKDDFQTIPIDDDLDFDMLSKQISQEKESIKIDDILFSESTEKPEDNVWESLNSIPIQDEEVENVAINRYFEILPSNAIFGTINAIFNIIKPKDDRTRLTRISFRYIHNSKTQQTYLLIVSQTSKPMRRAKKIPFIFQMITAMGSHEDETLEGVFHLTPVRKSIHDDVVSRKKIEISEDLSPLKTSLVNQIQASYPYVLKPSHAVSTEQIFAYDQGIDIDVFVIVR